MTVSIEKPFKAPSAPKLALKKFGKLLRSAFTPSLKLRQNAKAPLGMEPKVGPESYTAPSVKAVSQRPRQTVGQLSTALNECGLYL
jgi:hypothetical protein